MRNLLDVIIEQKRKEVAALSENLEYNRILRESKPVTNDFKKALQGPQLAIISEIKRRSPSVGGINEILDPVKLSQCYRKGGASAISVLTDHHFFGGSVEDLKVVREALGNFPLLRKDFIIDPLQIAEALWMQASAVLLIVSVLGKATSFMLKETYRLGLEAIVEIHNIQELQIAMDAGAEIIGVNCRNLKTFEIDLRVTETVISHIPQNLVKIAESGIKNEKDAQWAKQLGYDAILVGETLVRASDPSSLIRAMRS